METHIVPENANLESRIDQLRQVRNMSADEFVDRHASGTLRKNKQLGFTWRDQYLCERVAYEFGWEFSITKRSRILVGDPYTEGDNKALTEAGWHMERYIRRAPFIEDKFRPSYLHVEESDGRKEGVGLVVEQTSAAFIPQGHVVYALIAQYDPLTHKWREAKNPF